MRLLWEATDATCELGDDATIRAAVKTAFDAVPKDHLRFLQGVTVLDTDPKGRNLGVYLRDHTGAHIEIYLRPHVADALKAPADARLWALRLNLAHTLFHEVGHHMTLTVNRRMAPSRKRVQVEDALEKWAEEYVAKRMQKFCDAQVADGGPAADERPAFARAIRFLQGHGA